MKLSDIEERLISGLITDETIAQFKTALKRAPKRNRCEHCYTTAVAFPKKHWEEAIALIQYGLTEPSGWWVDDMRAYTNMGIVYEGAERYSEALLVYQQALGAVPDEHRPSYESDYAADFMRVEMHNNGFCYTEDLKAYYEVAMKGSDFSKAFLHRIFYQLLAEMLIYANDNEPAKARQACEKAKAMLSPAHQGILSRLLARHKYTETAGATKAAIRFLSTWRA